MKHIVHHFVMGLLSLFAVSAGAAPVAAANWTDGGGSDIEIRPNLVYHKASGQELKLDLYLPYERRRPVPLLLFIHGGGWVGGSKEVANLRLLPYLAAGWAAANVQYRLASTAAAPAAVEDVRCALRRLSARAGEFGIDPQRIVLSGGSAGGHLALMAGMLPAGNRFDRACPTEGAGRWRNGDEPALKVAAIINWHGITDLNDLLTGPNAKHYAIEWLSVDPAREALAREISPLTYVRADTPPVFSIHGDADDVVPPDHARRLHAALSAAGVANELILVPGARHGFTHAQTTAIMPRVRTFLAAHGISGKAP